MSEDSSVSSLKLRKEAGVQMALWESVHARGGWSVLFFLRFLLHSLPPKFLNFSIRDLYSLFKTQQACDS